MADSLVLPCEVLTTTDRAPGDPAYRVVFNEEALERLRAAVSDRGFDASKWIDDLTKAIGDIAPAAGAFAEAERTAPTPRARNLVTMCRARALDRATMADRLIAAERARDSAVHQLEVAEETLRHVREAMG